MPNTRIFYGLIFLALLGGGFYLLSPSWHAEESADGILARIARSTGQVETRKEDGLLWNDITEQQPLSRGQWVGTGLSGTALIRFHDGRSLSLGPNTQIVVDSQVNDQGVANLVVTLLKGDLKALAVTDGHGKNVEMIVKSKSGITRLRLANDQVALHQQPQPKKIPLANSIVQLTKPVQVEQPAQVKQPLQASVKAEETVRNSLATPAQSEAASSHGPIAKMLTAKNLRPSASSRGPTSADGAPVAHAPARPKEVAAAIPYEALTPQVQDLEGERLWTAKSLRDKNLVIPVTLAGPEELPTGLSWKPFVEVVAVKTGEKIEHSAAPTHGTKLFSHPVPLPPLGEVAVTSGMVKITVEAGAWIRRQNGERAVRSDIPVVRYVGSLSDMSNTAGLIIHFEPGGPGVDANKEWFAVADETRGGDEAPVTLKLAAGHDLRFLGSIIRSAKTLHIAQDKPELTEREAVYFVRDQRIVAQASGSALTPTVIQELAQALGVILTYRGTAAAFVARPTGYDELLAKIRGSAPTKRFYIYDKRYGDATYSLSSVFTVGTPAFIDYLKRGATAVFTQPVEFLVETTDAH